MLIRNVYNNNIETTSATTKNYMHSFNNNDQYEIFYKCN